MSATNIIVTAPIPGGNCTCTAQGNNCSNPETAVYSCELSNNNQVTSQVVQTVHKTVGIISYSTIILGFVLFPLFVLIAIARLVFFLKKSDRLKTTFTATSIFFLVVLVLYFGGHWLSIIAPWTFR